MGTTRLDGEPTSTRTMRTLGVARDFVTTSLRKELQVSADCITDPVPPVSSIRGLKTLLRGISSRTKDMMTPRKQLIAPTQIKQARQPYNPHTRPQQRPRHTEETNVHSMSSQQPKKKQTEDLPLSGRAHIPISTKTPSCRVAADRYLFHLIELIT